MVKHNLINIKKSLGKKLKTESIPACKLKNALNEITKTQKTQYFHSMGHCSLFLLERNAAFTSKNSPTLQKLLNYARLSLLRREWEELKLVLLTALSQENIEKSRYFPVFIEYAQLYEAHFPTGLVFTTRSSKPTTSSLNKSLTLRSLLEVKPQVDI